MFHVYFQDIFFNDCHYPYAMDSVHREKIEPCHETCKVGKNYITNDNNEAFLNDKHEKVL